MPKNTLFYFDPFKTKIIHGAKGAAVYDLIGGEVIPISPVFSVYLNDENQSIHLPLSPPMGLSALIENLYQRDLGRYTPYLQAKEPNQSPLSLSRDFAWLELTEQCNLKCLHCYGEFGQGIPSKSHLSYDEWKHILHQVHQNGFDHIQFIGGEPLLSPHLLPLLYEADQLDFSFIEIFSNLLLLDDETLNCIKACKAQLATTLYSADPVVHDSITGMTGSFEQTTQAIKRATQRRIPLRIGCIVTFKNEGRVGDLKTLSDTLGATYSGEDLTRPTGRGTESTCKSTIPRHAISQHFYTNHDSFQKAKQFNTCWNGKIAITNQGEVLPCVFARNNSAGNLRETTLENILTTIQSPMGYWSLNKDHIETCKDCEFRYACSDCRPLATGWANGNPLAKTYGCPYDPYTATWR